MPWIESHTDLAEHPKVFSLAQQMKWNRFEALGRLKCFWYWCLKYAPTGNLRKFNDELIGMSVELNGQDATRFVQAMIASGWIDRFEGGLRVHDWIEYAGKYLKDSLFKRCPERWEETEKLYRLPSVDCPQTVGGLSALPNQPTVPGTHTHGKSRSRSAIPRSEAEAVEWASMENVPAEFAKQVFHQLEGRGWKDGAGVQVENFRSHVRYRWTSQHTKAPGTKPGKGKPAGKEANQIPEKIDVPSL